MPILTFAAWLVLTFVWMPFSILFSIIGAVGGMDGAWTHTIQGFIAWIILSVITVSVFKSAKG